MERVNRFLRGWAAYFRYGNSAGSSQDQGLCVMRLALLHRQTAQTQPWLSVVRWCSIHPPNQLGLVSLEGIVVAPRPFRAWRGTPNAGGERRR